MNPPDGGKDEISSSLHEATAMSSPGNLQSEHGPDRPQGRNRRRWLLTAAVASSAGLAGALWRERGASTSGQETAPVGAGAGAHPNPNASASKEPAGSPPAVWDASFPRPGGGPPLALASLRGKPLIVNFWATWCPPCLREMPALERFQRQFANQSWQVLGLAVDSEQAVLAYLAKNPVGYAVALAGLEGIDLSRTWGNSQGGLPFTVVFDRIGRVTHTHLGEASDAQMAAWATNR